MEHSCQVFQGYTLSVYAPQEAAGLWRRLLALFSERLVHVRVVFHDPDAPCPRCRVRLARTFEMKFEDIIDEVEARPSLAHMDLLIRKELKRFMEDGDYDFIKQAVADQTARCMDTWHQIINRKFSRAR